MRQNPWKSLFDVPQRRQNSLPFHDTRGIAFDESCINKGEQHGPCGAAGAIRGRLINHFRTGPI